jgi:hypothetical protein
MRNGDIVAFAANGTRLGTFHTPYRWDVEYATKRVDGSIGFSYVNSGERRGYTSVAATEHYVFGLFSGRKRLPQRTAWAANYVHVFDWDGKLHAVFRLDVDAIRLEVSEELGMLYVVTVPPSQNSVTAFRIPGRWQGR